MAGQLHNSDFNNPVIQWIDTRLPIFTMMQKEYAVFPTPKNFNYFWNFGALAMVTLVIMIAHRHLAGDELQPNTDARLRFRRAHHARRELRLADPLHPHERRVDVLHRHLHPHVPRALLRLLQDAARAAVDARRGHPAADDGDGVHGLRAALGADELLGRHRHHQPVLGVSRSSAARSSPGCGAGSAVGNPTLEPVLLAALPAAVRARRRGGPASSRRCTSSARTIRWASTCKAPQDTVPFHPYYTDQGQRSASACS